MRKTISAVFASQRFSSDTRDTWVKQLFVATQRRNDFFCNLLFIRLMRNNKKVKEKMTNVATAQKKDAASMNSILRQNLERSLSIDTPRHPQLGVFSF